jgi:hypothetical protein
MKYLLVHKTDAPFYIVAYLLKQDIGKCLEFFFFFFFQIMVINDPQKSLSEMFSKQSTNKEDISSTSVGRVYGYMKGIYQGIDFLSM